MKLQSTQLSHICNWSCPPTCLPLQASVSIIWYFRMTPYCFMTCLNFLSQKRIHQYKNNWKKHTYTIYPSSMSAEHLQLQQVLAGSWWSRFCSWWGVQCVMLFVVMMCWCSSLSWLDEIPQCTTFSFLFQHSLNTLKIYCVNNSSHSPAAHNVWQLSDQLPTIEWSWSIISI